MSTINRNKEIKTDTIALVNKATEIHNRNEKAYSYSKSVARKAKRKEELKAKIIVAVIGIPMLATGIILGAMGVSNTIKAEIITESTTEVTVIPNDKQTAVLVDIDENGEYILQTEDGNLWSIIDPEEIYFEIEIDDNGSENVKDHVITSVELMK